MSKTVDDLIAVFEKARAEAAPFPQHHEDGLYAGIAAVIRALRDEIGEIGFQEETPLDPAIDFLDEILGAVENEKVAGGPRPEAMGSAPPATSPAPAVCEWTGEEYVTYSTSCESEHEVDPHKAPPTYCPSCGKPIKFTEAK